MAESLSYSLSVESREDGPLEQATSSGSADASTSGSSSMELTPASSGGPDILDYSFTGFSNQEVEEALANQPCRVFQSVDTILATNASLLTMPNVLSCYTNLKNLDLSYNHLTFVPEALLGCQHLINIVLKNNLIDDSGFPKDLSRWTQLKELNLSGNLLTRVPDAIVQLAQSLVSLHLGANRISTLPRDIGKLKKLQVFYLGGNQLTELPMEIGLLTQLKVLVLCENALETVPSSVSNLKQLKSLLLHRNHITALPVELVKLRNLMELSLRDNPLVVRFVRDLMYNPPSLMELAGRTIKIKKIPYTTEDLPGNLTEYLGCAHSCVNPKCKGVYFDNCVEHIKFVDFCGKYRVPLLQYLCSPKCSDHHSPAVEASSSDSEAEDDRVRKVLLG